MPRPLGSTPFLVASTPIWNGTLPDSSASGRRLLMTEPRPVLVVDFGAQYAQLIARRVRECHVYSEIVPHDTPVADLVAKRPAGLILSGGPASVYEAGAPGLDRQVFSLGVPV